MEISSDRENGALLLKTEGRVDGSTAALFQDGIKSSITPDDDKVILDLEQLDYISSAGLRIILLIAKDLKQQNSQFAICSLSDSVMEIFTMSGFNQIIKIHDSPAAALAAMS